MAIEKRHFKSNKNRIYYYLAGGMLVIIILLMALTKAGVIGDKNTVMVETDMVTKRSISEVITASGKLKPEIELSISSDVSGEIIELDVKDGDRVKKGDLLCRIKPDEYKSMLEEAVAAYNGSLAGLENAKANLDQAKALLDKAKVQYERYVTLKQKEAISDTEFERVNSEFLTAKAQYESARQGVETAKYTIVSAEARKNKAFESLSKTTLYAPLDGIITRLNCQEGERVVGTAQMAGTVIMRLADLSQMIVNIDVNENDIIRISLGDTADIEVDAFMNEKFKGVVSEIANSSKDATGSIDQITTFEIKVKILRSSYEHLIDTNRVILTPFRPGMSAMVDIYTSKVNAVLSVPILAVTTRQVNPEGEEYKSKKKGEDESSDKTEVVFIFDDGKLVMTPVEIGIQDDYYIQIISGLEDNNEVVSGPYSVVSKILKDGMKVKRKTADKKITDE